MALINLSELKTKELIKGFDARFIHTENLTLGYVTIKSGSVLPPHSHANEQVTHVLEGKLEMNIGGVTQIAEHGKVAVIPSGVVHSAKALSDCQVLDVFYPVREDYK